MWASLVVRLMSAMDRSCFLFSHICTIYVVLLKDFLYVEKEGVNGPPVVVGRDEKGKVRGLISSTN